MQPYGIWPCRTSAAAHALALATLRRNGRSASRATITGSAFTPRVPLSSHFRGDAATIADQVIAPAFAIAPQLVELGAADALRLAELVNGVGLHRASRRVRREALVSRGDVIAGNSQPGWTKRIPLSPRGLVLSFPLRGTPSATGVASYEAAELR